MVLIRVSSLVLIALGVSCWGAHPARSGEAGVGANAPPSLARRVNGALDLAGKNLLSRQADDGSFGAGDKVHPIGRTALCAYALLHSGLPRDHPAIGKVLGHLKIDEKYGGSVAVTSTYEAACLVFFLNAHGKHKRAVAETCEWLIDHFRSGEGMWAYPGGTADLSNTIFAAMALTAGRNQGYAAPRKVWESLVDGVLRHQGEDGRFRYHGNSVPRASMTHAGLICLELARRGLRKKRLSLDVQKALKAGHRWCDRNFTVEHAPFGDGFHDGYYHYYMWGLARYGVIFEKKNLGGRDWYKEGAEELLARQEENGSWGSLENTAFAILFLRKAALTDPVPRALESGTAFKYGIPKKMKERPRPPAAVGAIKSWLVAGPYLGKKLVDGMLETRHFSMARVSPAAGRSAGKKKWKRFDSAEDVVDLEKAVGPSDFSAYYAAVWLRADSPIDVVFWVGSDDGFKIYLNGAEIGESKHHDYSGDDKVRVAGALKKGPNLLILKVVDIGYYCRLRVRMSDAQGKVAPPGVSISTSR